jgi:hypothetical protein
MKRQAGQATVEYVFVAAAVLMTLVVVSAGGRAYCLQNLSGDRSATECKSLGRATTAALKQAVEEVTFLINLPF